MKPKTKKDKLLGIIVFIAIIFVSIVVGIGLIINVISSQGLVDDEVNVDYEKRKLSSRYDNVEISGAELMSIVRCYINEPQITIVLLDSETKSILATTGQKSIYSNDLIKKDNYYEIENNKYIVDYNTNYATKIKEFDEYIDASETYNTYLLKLIADENESDLIGLVVVK